MNKHTPGPWRIDPTCNADIQSADGTREIATVITGFNSFAIVHPNGAENLSEAEANGRLIAAAPELLEALRAMLAQHHGGSVVSEAHWTAARAAIAKATEENP